MLVMMCAAVYTQSVSQSVVYSHLMLIQGIPPWTSRLPARTFPCLPGVLKRRKPINDIVIRVRVCAMNIGSEF